MFERKISEKYNNLREDEVNSKNNKWYYNFYYKTLLAKKDERKVDEFIRKINESRIHNVKIALSNKL